MTSHEEPIRANPLTAAGSRPDSSDRLTLIAGYRVLRRLASSERADIYAGVAPSWAASGEPPEGEMAAPTRTVALKVFRPEADDASIEREIRALTETSPGRLAGLLDVATLPGGRMCLVLELLTGGSLGRHLADGRWVEPGEAVTILAPVVVALAELQAIGLVHLGLTPAVILFDSRGRPVLAGLGGLRAFPEPGPARRALTEDAAGCLSHLVRIVLDRVGPDPEQTHAARELAEWFAAAAPRVPGATRLADLERRLFAWSDAGPVCLGSGAEPGHDPDSAVTVLRLRSVAPVTGASPATAGGGGTDRSSSAGWGGPWFAGPVSAVRAAAGVVLAVLGRGAGRDNGAGVRLWAWLRPALRARRGPALAGVVVAVLVAGVAVSGLRPARGARPGESAPGPPVVPAASVPASAAALTPSDRVAVNGDDPVTAVQALLGLRDRCLSAASVACLDGAEQAQSSALAADSHTVHLAQQGGAAAAAIGLASWTPVLAYRTGDVALVTLTATDAQRKPASVLVVKGEAGWRIREIFDD
ncbi:hypothetical protein [Cryobacterium sp. TMT4-10]|uniref:hypothetical protein n=1 Tax=Cryobacterium sp. TMT4-10 TaxID=1259256 RepID=UPI00106C69CF|nr:hypothetical protein [Cryobacterium sp. TMT4-10]TFD17692.1 hypothetical protein E3T42_07165 [Cryobacterium sp. TMT4-10]